MAYRVAVGVRQVAPVAEVTAGELLVTGGDVGRLRCVGGISGVRPDDP